MPWTCERFGLGSKFELQGGLDSLHGPRTWRPRATQCLLGPCNPGGVLIVDHIPSTREARVVDSVLGDARTWIDNSQPSRSTVCENTRTNSLGSLLHGRPGGRLRSVWCGDCVVHPLGSGGF